MQRFEENLQALGFDNAPIAWDIAQIKFESDQDRYAVLAELRGVKGGGQTSNA